MTAHLKKPTAKLTVAQEKDKALDKQWPKFSGQPSVKKKQQQLFASIWFWYDDLSWTILANGLTSTVPLVRDWQSYVDSSQMAGSCAQLLSKQHWRNTWDRGEVAHMQACPSL